MQALVLLAIVLAVLVLARYALPALRRDVTTEDPQHPQCRRDGHYHPMPQAYRPMIPSGIEYAAKELTR